MAARPQNTKRYFKRGLTWNKLSVSRFAVKYKDVGYIFDDTSRSAFLESDKNLFYYIGLLCSKVTFEYLAALNPTMSFTNGDLLRIPCKLDVSKKQLIDKLVADNIELSKMDWNSNEVSWNFKSHPLVRSGYTINELYKIWELECFNRFTLMKNNEEKINEVFINLYGLQNEMTVYCCPAN